MPVFVRASRRAKAHVRRKPLNLVPRRSSTIKEFKLTAKLVSQGLGPGYGKVMNRVMASSARDLALKMNVGLWRKQRKNYGYH